MKRISSIILLGLCIIIYLSSCSDSSLTIGVTSIPTAEFTPTREFFEMSLANVTNTPTVAAVTPTANVTNTPTQVITVSPTPTATMTPTKTITSVIVYGWENAVIKTLCLNANVSNSMFGGANSSPIIRTIEHIVNGFGIEITSEPELCDATLTLELILTPLDGTYSHRSASQNLQCWNGAEINGELSLKAPGHDPITSPIYESLPPPGAVSRGDCISSARGAPISKLWPRPLLEGLFRFWGVEVYRQASSSENQTVADEAKELLIPLH